MRTQSLILAVFFLPVFFFFPAHPVRAESVTRSGYAVSVSLEDPRGLHAGSKVMLRERSIGEVVSVQAASSESGDRFVLKLSLEPEARGELKQGTVAVVTSKQADRVLELLIPPGVSDVLRDAVPIPGYSSYERFWLDDAHAQPWRAEKSR